MARLQAYLVSLWACLIIAGCAPAHLGQTIFIEDDFTEEERPAIEASIQVWNQFSLELTGQVAFYYGGVYSDPDGFDALTDLSDNRSVIYKTEKPLDEDKTTINGGHTLGMAFQEGDVSIVSKMIAACLYPEDDYLEVLQYITTHELGHVIGMPDKYDLSADTIMNMYFQGVQMRFSDYDRQTFCQIHDCK
jgi:hypothetical protein